MMDVVGFGCSDEVKWAGGLRLLMLRTGGQGETLCIGISEALCLWRGWREKRM
jgi:hypothetical protein